jgi:prevent-host-death family protein
MTPKRRPARQYNVAEAKARLSDLVRKALVGEEVVIAKDHKPLVKLVPLTPGGARIPGTAKGLVTIAPDFDQTPDDFADYM